MSLWSRRIIALGLGVLALGGPAGADMTKPAPVAPSTPAGSTPEDEFNRGLRARAAKAICVECAGRGNARKTPFRAAAAERNSNRSKRSSLTALGARA